MKCLLTALTVLTLMASACGGSDASASDEDLVRPVDTSGASTESSTSATTATASTTTLDTSVMTTAANRPSGTASTTQGNITRPTAPPGTGYVDQGASPELEAELIGVAREVRKLVFDAALTRKLPSGSLDQLMMPSLAQRYRQLVNDWKAAGEIGRLPANSIAGSTFAVIFVDGDLAVIQECVTDDVIVTIAKTGAVIDAGIDRSINEWTIRKTSDGWKASDQTTVLSGQSATESDRCDFS